jgi:Arc/MetJ-type ribon-helix-helix transcriptional regulator
MSNVAKTIVELPEAFQAFAEERVRSGQAASVEEVAREAFREKQLAALNAELDAGFAEIEAGDCIEIDDPKEMLLAMREDISFDEMRARLEAKKVRVS